MLRISYFSFAYKSNFNIVFPYFTSLSFPFYFPTLPTFLFLPLYITFLLFFSPSFPSPLPFPSLSSTSRSLYNFLPFSFPALFCYPFPTLSISFLSFLFISFPSLPFPYFPYVPSLSSPLCLALIMTNLPPHASLCFFFHRTSCVFLPWREKVKVRERESL